jgi:hypothetical protein
VLTVYVVSHPLTFLKTFVLLLFLACLEPETKVLLFYASGLIIISPCMKLFSLINILMLWPFSLSLPVGCLLIYIIKLKLMFFFFSRYVALNMLMNAITVDAQAVQRHRATILECVKVFHGHAYFFFLNNNEKVLN